MHRAESPAPDRQLATSEPLLRAPSGLLLSSAQWQSAWAVGLLLLGGPLKSASGRPFSWAFLGVMWSQLANTDDSDGRS